MNRAPNSRPHPFRRRRHRHARHGIGHRLQAHDHRDPRRCRRGNECRRCSRSPRASSSASTPRRRPISRYGERRRALAPVEFEPIMFRCPRAASASRASDTRRIEGAWHAAAEGFDRQTSARRRHRVAHCRREHREHRSFGFPGRDRVAVLGLDRGVPSSYSCCSISSCSPRWLASMRAGSGATRKTKPTCSSSSIKRATS